MVWLEAGIAAGALWWKVGTNDVSTRLDTEVNPIRDHEAFMGNEVDNDCVIALDDVDHRRCSASRVVGKGWE